MKNFLAVLCLLASVSFTPVAAADAESAAVKKKLQQRVDAVLRATETAKADASRILKMLEQSLDGLLNTRLKTQLLAETLAKELKANKQKLEETKVALGKVREELRKAEADPNYKPRIGDKEYTREELKALVDKLALAQTKLAAQTEAMAKQLEEASKQVALLETREKGGRQKLDDAKGILKKIDTRITVIAGVQEVIKALDEADKDFAAKVKQIEERLKSLESPASSK